MGDPFLVTGLALAGASAFFNGTFSMFGKLCKKEPDPIVFNTMLTYGACVSSLLAVFLLPSVESRDITIIWSWWGALAGTLFVFATLFSFIAIPLVGLAVASATWGCAAMIVAFLWGAVGPSPPAAPMKNVGMSLLAIVLLVLGVLIINCAPRLAAMLGSQRQEDGLEEGLSPPGQAVESSSTDSSSSSAGESPAAARTVRNEAVDEEQVARGTTLAGRTGGVISAIAVGIFGGSILVPSSQAEPELQGLEMMPSFGIAAAVVGSFVCILYWAARRQPFSALLKEFRPEVIRNGLASGVIWNLSNICQVIAQGTFELSYGIAYPILQCALVFSGIWGIYYFKEESNRKAVAIFWMGAAVLLCGVVLLGTEGPGAGGHDHPLAARPHVIASPEEFLTVLQSVSQASSCDVQQYEVPAGLFGTLTYFNREEANAIHDIGAGKPMTWLSGPRTLSRFLNSPEGCCGVGSMSACLCNIAENLGIINAKEHLSYLKPVPPYSYVYVALRARVTNDTNADGDSVSAMVPTWETLLDTVPSLLPVIFKEQVPCKVPEDVRSLLEKTPYKELFQKYSADFSALGASAESCKVEQEEVLRRYGPGLCSNPAALRAFLCTYLDANPLFEGTGYTSGGVREFITVPSPHFSSIQEGAASAAKARLRLQASPGSVFQCLPEE